MKEGILLTTLLDSKRFVKESSPVTFPAPKEILSPFIEAVESNPINGEWHVQVQNPVTNINTDGSENTAYPRVLVEKRFQISQLEENSFNLSNKYTIGLLYALDIQNPALKLYQGSMATACTNLSIFRATDIVQKNLLGDFSSIPELANRFVNETNKTIEFYHDVHDKMNNMRIKSTDKYFEVLGWLLNDATSKSNPIPTSTIINAAKLLQDRHSKYYWDTKTDLPVWQIYQAITQGITDSPELYGVPDKTFAIGKSIYTWGRQYAN